MRKRRIRPARRATDPAELLTRRRTPAELARALSGPGERIGVATVREHVAAGAPTDARGRLALGEYAAWLIDRLAAGELPAAPAAPTRSKPKATRPKK